MVEFVCNAWVCGSNNVPVVEGNKLSAEMRKPVNCQWILKGRPVRVSKGLRTSNTNTEYLKH